MYDSDGASAAVKEIIEEIENEANSNANYKAFLIEH